MWCPQCGSEYRDGFTTCADCGVALVASPPAAPGDERRDHRHDQRRHQPHERELTNDDVLVELVRLGAVEAEVVAARLRGEGVDAVAVGVGTAGDLAPLQFSEGSRVMVRKADRRAAQELLERFDAPSAGDALGDAELADLAERATYAPDPQTGAAI